MNQTCDAKPILWTRKQYMAGEVDHDTYYGQFVTPEIIERVLRHIGVQRILESKDVHMNDIPLSEWDGMSPSIIRLSARRIREAGDVYAATLGNAVCVAKAAARQIKRGSYATHAQASAPGN